MQSKPAASVRPPLCLTPILPGFFTNRFRCLVPSHRAQSLHASAHPHDLLTSHLFHSYFLYLSFRFLRPPATRFSFLYQRVKFGPRPALSIISFTSSSTYDLSSIYHINLIILQTSFIALNQHWNDSNFYNLLVFICLLSFFIPNLLVFSVLNAPSSHDFIQELLQFQFRRFTLAHQPHEPLKLLK